MAVAYNPPIVTNGLVLALDAGNNKSHSTNKFISYGSGLVTENVTFSIQGTGTFQRVAAGTVIGGYTVKTTDVVYSYALGATGCHYHGNSIPIPAGVSATFSFDYLVTGATTYPINDYLANFESALGGAVATANNLQNVWQRRTFTAGPTGAAGTLNAYLYPGACGGGRLADSGTIYYRNPKVEFTSVDTGDGNFSSMSSNLTTWTNLTDTGNNGTLTNGPYHIIGSDGSKGYMSFDGVDDYAPIGTTGFPFGSSAGTLSCWAKTNTITGSTSWIVSYGTGATSQSRFLGIVGSIYYFGGYGNDITASGVPLNTWFNMVGVYDGTNASMYVNGVLVSGPTAKTWNTVANNAQLGRQTNGSEYWNGSIAQVSVYNRALSAAEIQQNFNATRGRFGI